jgi:hypothetical protein
VPRLGTAFYELGGIILFALVIGFELLAYMYGNRVSSLEADERAAMQAQVVRANEQAQRAGLEAEKLSAELTALQRGRLLSGAQASKLLELLRVIQKPGEALELTGIQGDAEAVRLSNQLRGIFSSAGFKVNGPWEDIVIGGIGDGIAVRQRYKQAAIGVAISSALQDVGLTTRIIEKSDLRPNQIEVIVGRRP